MDEDFRLDELLAANRRAAEQAPPPPSSRPVRRMAVVTCMDARITPLDALGLAPGDVHVIRNAGGRVTEDVVRSLILSVRLLEVRTILVIHHTACALLSDPGELRERLASAGVTATGIDFLSFQDQEQAVREDVEAIRDSPFLEGADVRGLIYDVETGLLRAVEESSDRPTA